MNPFDLTDFYGAILDEVKSHALDRPGAYLRVRDAEEDPLNPYGCSDAANILYTLGCFPGDPDERRSWVEVLQGLQSSEDGLFHEASHHPFHTTAHCAAALELFEARPANPLRGMDHLMDPKSLVSFLDQLDWTGASGDSLGAPSGPWASSHRGAGLFAAKVNAGESNPQWEKAYFSWLSTEFDPETGVLRKGCVNAPGSVGLFNHLGGTFHYLFNMEFARQPIPFPQAMVETCLRIFNEKVDPDLGQRVSFPEVDWVYSLNRSWRQCGHRTKEVKQALEAFAQGYLDYLLSLDREASYDWKDMHTLFGMCCCLAELQTVLPGKLVTPRPLKLVLDRRPFI